MSHRPARLRAARLRLGPALLVLFVFVLAAVPPALAQQIPRLEAAVTDQTGVLDERRAEVEGALERLFQRSGVQLYVLFVQTTGDMHIADYAAAVGDQSLGGTDALLVVALADRTVDLSIGADLRDRVSQTSLDSVRTQVLEPGLAAGDFGGAVIDTAAALEPVFAPAPVVTPPPATPRPPVTPPGEGAAGGINLMVVLGVLLIAVGVVWLASRVRALRVERQQAFEEAKLQEEMGRQANSMLIATDDALRDAEQELGFAEAEFGADQARAMREELTAARVELNAAFTIGQKLDDSEPETPEQRRQMIAEIIERCTAVEQKVTAQAAQLARLRDLERNAPAVLERLEAKARDIERRLVEAEAVGQRLARYGAESTQSVAGNEEEARARFAEAADQLQAGRGALGEGNTAQAAVAANGAQDLLEDALALLDAMTRLAESLDQTAARLKSELPAARANVEAARTAAAREPAAAGLTAILTEATTALADAERAAAESAPDVLTAYRRATEANAAADRLLQGAREEAARRERAHQSAVAAISASETSYARASDYVASHRRSQQIGRMARNRLAEAERHLSSARSLLATDSAAALREAQAADRLANEALSLARQLPPSYDPYDPQRHRPNTDLGSLVAGAILGSMLGGGGGRGRSGRGRSGRPQAPTRLPGGGWGGRSSGGGFGGGGFGSGGFGGGVGGSRSGRGGFGGGRSSSGRW